MELLTANYKLGKVRRVERGGKQWFVAPLSLIVPGVLNGSKGALYYPKAECHKNVQAWNGTPLVVYHPQTHDGHVSAHAPGILEKQGIGHIENAEANGKLKAEGWFDVEKVQQVDNRVYEALATGRPMELSTGLYTDNEPKQGEFNGRHYDAIATNYKPDHVAVLPDQIGACSLNDGCGVNVNYNPNHGEGGKFSSDAGSTGKKFTGGSLKLRPASIVPGHFHVEDKYGRRPKTPAFTSEKAAQDWLDKNGEELHAKLAKLPLGGTVNSKAAKRWRQYCKEVGIPLTTNAPYGASATLADIVKVPPKGTAGADDQRNDTDTCPQCDAPMGECRCARRVVTGNCSCNKANCYNCSTYNKGWDKAKRDALPDEDFAGPNKSFPIKTQQDVKDAADLAGHAADPAAVRAKIKDIAKRKGFKLPKSWTENQEKLMKREETIKFLVANCSCSGKEDPAELGKLTDNELLDLKRATVSKIVANAKAEGSFADAKGKGQSVQAGSPDDVQSGKKLAPNKSKVANDDDMSDNADDDNDDDEDDDNEPPAKGKKKAMTDNEWMAQAPPSVREAVQNAQQIVAKERKHLIARLVANVSDDAKKTRLTAVYNKMPIADLRDMAPVAVQNKQEPVYVGANSPFDTPPVSNFDKTDILPLPTMNYAEEAALLKQAR